MVSQFTFMQASHNKLSCIFQRETSKTLFSNPRYFLVPTILSYNWFLKPSLLGTIGPSNYLCRGLWFLKISYLGVPLSSPLFLNILLLLLTAPMLAVSASTLAKPLQLGLYKSTDFCWVAVILYIVFIFWLIPWQIRHKWM